MCTGVWLPISKLLQSFYSIFINIWHCSLCFLLHFNWMSLGEQLLRRISSVNVRLSFPCLFLISFLNPNNLGDYINTNLLCYQKNFLCSSFSLRCYYQTHLFFTCSDLNTRSSENLHFLSASAELGRRNFFFLAFRRDDKLSKT